MAWKTLHRHCGMMLIALIFVAGIRSGMFFDGDIYGVGAGFGVLLLLMMGVKWNGAVQSRKIHGVGVLSGSAPADRGLRVLLGCICGMILIYVLHGIGIGMGIGRALTLEGTMKEIILWGTYGSFAAVAWRICRRSDGLRMMQAGWHLMGAVLCGSALLAVYGLLHPPYGIYHTADADISATGARLGGLLQYPNTFGAVMAAFLLERLFALPSVLRTRTGPLRAAAAL
ncbi:O-antigen ligase domain-containing protein, partial [Paenibacillus lautus]|nr:O-antigen ligase domain-containing protein [Paenibacillus lautus]